MAVLLFNYCHNSYWKTPSECKLIFLEGRLLRLLTRALLVLGRVQGALISVTEPSECQKCFATQFLII
jgi:hypothetical protein